MNKRLLWFVVAVGAQLLILAAVPAQKIHSGDGQTTCLKRPVDPYPIMTGYYVRLGYDISSPLVLTEWKKWPEGKPVWVILKETQTAASWNAVSGSRQRPSFRMIVLSSKAKQRWRIEYGIEAYLSRGCKG